MIFCGIITACYFVMPFAKIKFVYRGNWDMLTP